MKKFNENYKRRYPGLSVRALKGKLMGAAAMLLVAATLMATASYAWFVLSTAPELTGVDTQVGANGALEIALLNDESWANLDKLDMVDIDENASPTDTDNNLTWGNLVDLSSARYGLNKITLSPSRLYMDENTVTENGKDVKKYTVNTTNLLKTPIYGEDGRVQGLSKHAALGATYDRSKGVFSGMNSHGVRAIGTSATMSIYQLGMNTARSNLTQYTSAARTTASNALNQNGNQLGGAVVKYALKKADTGYTRADMQAVLSLAEGIKDSLGRIDLALREVFAGFAATAAANLTGEVAYNTALEEIRNTATPLSDLLGKYPGVTGMVADMSTYITKLTDDITKVDQVIADCEAKLADTTKNNFTWGDLSGAVSKLVDTNKMTVGGKKLNEVKDSVMTNGKIDPGKALALIQGQGGIKVEMPSGSGVLADIADFAGDYAAGVTVKGFTYEPIITEPMDVNATMKTATNQNPTHLAKCGNAMRTAKVAEATGSNSITDFYGYAIDLAFRTNAAKSNLLLQTEPQNRVYGEDSQNEALQGGGSYMTFTTAAGLSVTKMVKLMRGIRVAFMDKEGNVFAIAALECDLGQKDYVELSNEEKISTGKFAYLAGAADGSYQVSDLISKAEYDAITNKEKGTVTIDKGQITAKLYLYDFEMTKKVDVQASEGVEEQSHPTGGLTLKGKKTSRAITALQQDVPQVMTTVVYLDGSVVNNSTVAANAVQSMSGRLNLQFSSDADLVPAENTGLKLGDAKREDTP